MTSGSLIICFTDLKGSTSQTEQLGNEGYVPGLLEHLGASEEFARISNGKYIKNIGDANLVTFAQFEDALRFATLLQEYCMSQPCLSRPGMGVKIGIGLGAAVSTEKDAFGAGMNEGARIQGKASSGQIVLNKAFQQFLRNAWGSDKVEKYVTSLGEYSLSGINNPPEQELFEFDWKNYAHDVPATSLAAVVLDHCNKAQVETSHLNANDLSNPGTIIWPVVPRDIVTAIHQGQVEIIRLLALLGWQLSLVIADCAAQPYDKKYSKDFAEQIQRYLSKRAITGVKVSYMSDLYAPNYDDHEKIYEIFREVSSKLTLSRLLAINNKNYDDVTRQDTLESATLDCLRPALTLAAVLFLAKRSQQKAVVVSGYDEEIQWETAFIIPGSRSSFGVLMNPILNDDKGNQARQDKQWPNWLSEKRLREDMESGNLAWWTFHLHVFLPAFPSQTVKIGDIDVTPKVRPKATASVLPEHVDKDQLAAIVWKVLDLAS